MSRHPRLAAVAVAVAALTLLAAGPASAGDPTVTDPRVVAHFDFAAGETPENIALEPDGSALLTFASAHKVVRVGRNGSGPTDVATLPTVTDPPGALLTGIARAHDGTLYVNYVTGTDEENGIWRIRPDGSAPQRIVKVPVDGFPNGLALDERCRTLYAADSARGVVWSARVPDGNEEVEAAVWATGAALRPTDELPYGANGLKLHDGAVWVSNSAHSTLLRIPFGKDRTAGPIQTRATGIVGIDDFAFTGHGDTVLAARVTADKLELVRPDGSHKTVLTAADGLDGPTSVAVRAKSVYVPSAAYFTTQDPDPNLLLARVSRNKL
ncbi:SMP-30/gluconolactonase/LRE family protein [Streptomyces sp. NPDC004266]|uniref:SMP-30/gluconolactonase/LRE family protein n=1 Tax=Streptomyces sp. NPDC004266 TaxID=3364693 RepID=UPI0036BD192E